VRLADLWEQKQIDFATYLLENVSTFEQMTLSLHTKIFSIYREWSERYEAIWDHERKHP
jgi:hypothetical protein